MIVRGYQSYLYVSMSEQRLEEQVGHRPESKCGISGIRFSKYKHLFLEKEAFKDRGRNGKG